MNTTIKIKTTPHFQHGIENKIAFVFSCPGKNEERECRPAAGTTGRNLETLLKILNEKFSTNDFTREKITITNSWPHVEYPAKTGRTEAKKDEILNEKNLSRLLNELKPVKELIICSGNNAKFAVSVLMDRKLIKKDIKTVFIPHLGTRGINMKIKEDIYGNHIKAGDKNATYKRLEKISENIIGDIKKYFSL